MDDLAPDSTEKTTDLIEALETFEGLSKLLADKDVKAALVAELRDSGVPAPGLVYRLIAFVAGKSEKFLGEAAKTRLTRWAEKSETLTALLTRIAELQKGKEKDADLKAKLIETIREGKPFDPDLPVEDAGLEIQMALHGARALEDVQGKLSDAEEVFGKLADETAALRDDLFGPNLSWPDELKAAETQGYRRLLYYSGRATFRGREHEIEMLHDFAGDPTLVPQAMFSWLLITGDGGMGKTRLAYEFTTRRLNAPYGDRAVWRTGKLTEMELRRLIGPANWRPKAPTFIVIDYAQNAPEDINRLMMACASQARSYEFPVRLLLVERRAEDSWTTRLVPPGDSGVLEACAYGGVGTHGYELDPFEPREVVEMMQERFAASEYDAPEPEQLFAASAQVDPRAMQAVYEGQEITVPLPRPLFALAVADAMIFEKDRTGDWPETLNREDVIAKIIERERLSIWAKAIPDDGKRQKVERCLALATLAQGMPWEEFMNAGRYGDLLKWLPDLTSLSETERAALGCRGEIWEGLEPDILGEYFLYKTLLDSPQLLPKSAGLALIRKTLHIGHPVPAITLARFARDFPHRADDLSIEEQNALAETEEEALALASFSIEEVNRLQGANADYETYFDTVWEMAQRFPQRAVFNETAQATFNVLNGDLKAEVWAGVDLALARFSALCEQFEDDHKIALEKGKAAVNVTSRAGAAEDWQRVDAMLSLLSVLRARFESDNEIALEEAKAVVNVIGDAGAAGDWDRVDAMLLLLAGIRARFEGDGEIALEEAKGAFNVTIAASRAQDWRRVEAMRDLLARLMEELGGEVVLAEFESDPLNLKAALAFADAVLAERDT